MLSESMLELLNQQINLEYYSSNLYLQMSSWCLSQGLDGCAAFLRQHSDEEKEHMIRLFDYVNETGAYALIGAIESPTTEFKTVEEVFEATYEHEVLITKKINDLAGTAFKENDFSTFNFLQWYVAEQHEEEQLFKSVLDKIKMIGIDGKGLFFIDQEVAKLCNATSTTTMETGA